MRFKIKATVKGNYRDVMKRFDRDLFEYLLPKGADVELVEFGGSVEGARVHIQFNSPISATWISEITEDGENDLETWFVDKGVVLPFGLRYWHHRHIVRRVSETESEIIDDIQFRCANGILTLLYFPFLYFGFYPRKRQYKRYFGN